MPVFLLRASVPGASHEALRAAADRGALTAARMRREGFRIRYLESTYVPADGWLGCLYAADSGRDVRLANERAAIPFDDVVEVLRYTSGGSVPCRYCAN